MPDHRTHEKCPVPSLLHPHPAPQTSQACAPSVSTAMLDSSRGALITLCPMSAPQNMDSSLTRGPHTHPGSQISTVALGTAPSGDSSPVRFFVLPRGAVGQHHPQGQHSRPAGQPARGREGALWLSDSLTLATQSLPSTHLHPSISTSPLETVP